MSQRRSGPRRVEPTLGEPSARRARAPGPAGAPRKPQPPKRPSPTPQAKAAPQPKPRPRPTAAKAAAPARKAPPQVAQKPKRRPASARPSPKARQQTLAALEAATRGSGRGKRQSPSFLWRATKFVAYWSVVAGIWGVLVVAGILTYYAAHLPPASEWAVPKRPPNVQIVAANGTLIGNRGDTGGEAIRLQQLPPYLPQAVLAIEDRRFYSHFGIDPIGLLRAAYTNYRSGSTVQGGSTLTQQLAKNLFLNPERTIQRKMQEVVMSLWLEANYSKDEILEMYLNRVYLGAGAYGVDAASRRYFDKSARLVTLSEAATLAGLLKAPSRLSPSRNPQAAEDRSQVVIAAMLDAGFITETQAKNALMDGFAVAHDFNRGSENYVADYVMDVLPSFIGKIDQDIIVETTVDMDMQRAAEDALRNALYNFEKDHGARQGAVVTLNRNGAIRAMVGGGDYSRSQYNRAAYAKRQPGSAFKPFVFLTALENGYTPNTVRNDRPITYRGWSPKNYNNRYYGDVTLTLALAKSMNSVAVQLANETGPKRVISTARRLGISSPLTSNPSLALGTSEVTPLEIAGAYVPFSNGGFGIVPHVVRKISTEDGRTLYTRRGDGTGRVISAEKVGQMNLMMANTMRVGTGRKAALDSRPSGGKTGTTQGSRDAWFIGYTASLTTAVWVGNDDNSPTNKVTGGGLPAEIWHETMQASHRGVPVAALPGVPLYFDSPSPIARPNEGALPPPSHVGSIQPSQQPARTGGPLNLLGRIFGGG
ncbi:PBP1A family penicillin-binding protein [Pseudovibrio sp. SPO723]|uniref:transglycosylase domain-containing protein n=1 Tax=Nesiotobacter zosterae TaxID=392721 RepID=UPI0029C15336|nr:PBP1A family penicillin-binding protein [Pseudovibrio sp. SPO723]MDX5595072.1 PBP1A family penicillin-binding protein [Pseudovibrio sp. SPO723]